MLYNKKDAQMTQGLAILSMVVLHLFCRKGSQIVCEPLIWINDEKPLVYWLGFFSEICVPLYSICAGYARYMLYEDKRAYFKDDLQRILKLMINYWIILIIFSALGLIFDSSSQIPGSLSDFLKSIVLLHSYNGAWWYLNTYIILLLIPSSILLFPVKKLAGKWGILGCNLLMTIYYLAGRFGFLPEFYDEASVLSFIGKELNNLMHVLPFIWLGAYFFKIKVFEKCSSFLEKKFKPLTTQIIVGGGYSCNICNFKYAGKSDFSDIFCCSSFYLFQFIEKAYMDSEGISLFRKTFNEYMVDPYVFLRSVI